MSLQLTESVWDSNGDYKDPSFLSSYLIFLILPHTSLLPKATWFLDMFRCFRKWWAIHGWLRQIGTSESIQQFFAVKTVCYLSIFTLRKARKMGQILSMGRPLCRKRKQRTAMEPWRRVVCARRGNWSTCQQWAIQKQRHYVVMSARTCSIWCIKLFFLPLAIFSFITPTLRLYQERPTVENMVSSPSKATST
jgi:hypothetical protein